MDAPTIEELYDLVMHANSKTELVVSTRALLVAVLEAADMGYDERVEGAPNCRNCGWNSRPYPEPCEEHSQQRALLARIKALPNA